MKIQAEQIVILDIDQVVPNPKNPNVHSKEQIERLAKLIKYQGFRNPLIISKRSGFLVVGHGRLESAKKLGLKKLPVIYQDFDSEAQEYAYVVSDNAVAEWSKLNLSDISIEMENFGPDFDLEHFGLKNFKLDLNETLKDEPIIAEEHILSVYLKTEEELQYLYEELKERNFECKLI